MNLFVFVVVVASTCEYHVQFAMRFNFIFWLLLLFFPFFLFFCRCWYSFFGVTWMEFLCMLHFISHIILYGAVCVQAHKNERQAKKETEQCTIQWCVYFKNMCVLYTKILNIQNGWLRFIRFCCLNKKKEEKTQHICAMINSISYQKQKLLVSVFWVCRFLDSDCCVICVFWILRILLKVNKFGKIDIFVWKICLFSFLIAVKSLKAEN